MEERADHYATNLTAVMKAQGRKGTWLAAQLGVTKYLVSHIMAGRRPVTRARAERVAELIGVPVFVLFELRETSESRSLAERAVA